MVFLIILFGDFTFSFWIIFLILLFALWIPVYRLASKIVDCFGD